MDEKFYTLRVHLCNGKEITFKNLNDSQEKEARAHIWTHGIKKQNNHNTWELISPFIIQSAFVIQQEGLIE
jgi:hypothetical protein